MAGAIWLRGGKCPYVLDFLSLCYSRLLKQECENMHKRVTEDTAESDVLIQGRSRSKKATMKKRKAEEMDDDSDEDGGTPTKRDSVVSGSLWHDLAGFVQSESCGPPALPKGYPKHHDVFRLLWPSPKRSRDAACVSFQPCVSKPLGSAIYRPPSAGFAKWTQADLSRRFALPLLNYLG
jgi:hypothetical protein